MSAEMVVPEKHEFEFGIDLKPAGLECRAPV